MSTPPDRDHTNRPIIVAGLLLAGIGVSRETTVH
jgi:hypothetical protein